MNKQSSKVFFDNTNNNFSPSTKWYLVVRIYYRSTNVLEYSVFDSCRLSFKKCVF